MEFELTLTLTQKQSVHLREFLYGIVNTIFFNRVFRQIVPSNDLFLNTVEFPVLEDDPDLNAMINEKLDLIVSSVPSLSASRVSAFDSGSSYSHSDANLGSLDALQPAPAAVSAAPAVPAAPTAQRQHFKTSSNIKIKFYERSEHGRPLNCWEIWNIKVLILQAADVRGHKTLSTQSTGGVLISTGAAANTGHNSVHNSRQLDRDDADRLAELFESNLHDILDILDVNKNHIPPITSFDGFPYQMEVSNDDLDAKRDSADPDDAGSGYKAGRAGTSNYYVQGEDIFKSGFKFIKKMLTE